MHSKNGCAWNLCTARMYVHEIYARQEWMCMESMHGKNVCAWNLCTARMDVHGIYALYNQWCASNLIEA